MKKDWCLRGALAAVLTLGMATHVLGQEPAPPAGAAEKNEKRNPGESDRDTRTQYPAFLLNSFFSVNVGYIGQGFSGQQLERGYEAQGVDLPHLAARIGLFGHEFSPYLSVQATYMRPARYVTYHGVNGEPRSRQIHEAFGGVTVTTRLPVTARVSAYAEGGLGITSRSGVEIDGATVVRDAHFASGLLGAGLEYHLNRTVDVVFGATYSPGRKHFNQPSTRLYTTGFRYSMRAVPAAQVEKNREAAFSFPANLVRLGFSADVFAFGINDLFSRTIPVFWGGNVKTRRGLTIDYERNVFHTRKRFAFDLGASASYWKSSNQELFRTLSVYPLLRFVVLRAQSADVYVNYSVAGPSYISTTVIDGFKTGPRFTFQDFMGIGAYLGRSRRLNAELGIKHFSNGNMFTENDAIKIPLTLTLGYAF